ncbi:hypothetical protein pdam_00019549 [Pocillopora damicornis]|uniref:G-protein coupled receptors family 1 profile domain-containing protein n=1 Tax=Pocillopora damicornis TaxID=46731 RepID=A0A3M6TZF6_POCDA|nr:hypothetical protein pdam_00019549 [Pocillopora damicornis]
MTIVSYISVFITVRSNRHMHSNSAAGAREKKLTITLFTVIIGSLTAYFPLTIQLVRQRYYLAAIITYWKNSSSIIRGHLAHKSYYLCHAGTRTRRNVMEINFRRTSNCSKPSDIPLRAVAGPTFIQRVGATCNLWERAVWSEKYSYLTIALGQSLPYLSLLNLAVISLERAHATFFPFKYHAVKKWVYGVIVTVTWLMSATAALVGKDIGTKGRHTMYFSFFSVLLFVISVSYILIFNKVRFGHRLLNQGAASVRERKLTSTLFMVTLASILTWFPLIIGRSLNSFNPQLLKKLNQRLAFHMYSGVLVLYLANSLINPIIYAMRLPELRQGIMKIVFCRNSNSSNQDDSPLRNR